MRTKTALLLVMFAATAAPAVKASAQEPIVEAPAYDPLHANKDVEVGTFYLKKGNYDAAIDRFQEAARLQPGFAEPYMKLGETYEKKKDLPNAVASYRKYLDVYRTSPDAKKLLKHIDDLVKQIAREAAATKAAG